MGRRSIFYRCRNCTTSQQAKAAAPVSATKVPPKPSSQNPPEDAARSPPEPVKAPVATDFVGKAAQHPSQAEDTELKSESPVEREADPMERVAELGSPQQERATAESRALREAETDAVPVAVAISPHSAREAPPISRNALSVMSDAGNKLMLASAMMVVVRGAESELDQPRLTSKPAPISSVREAFDPVDGD